MCATFAHPASVHVARFQSEFLIAETAAPCAVVRPLSEGLPCVGFDAEVKVVRDKYRFLKPEDTLLTLRVVGPPTKADPQHVQDDASFGLSHRILTRPAESRVRLPTVK